MTKTNETIPGKAILLVEDEMLIAADERATLSRHGYSVVIASTGEDAVCAVTEQPGIDLVLMDIDLGKGMNGTEAAEIILGVRDVPVVFLSSHTEPEMVEKTEGISSYGYIVKNSGETVLIASIKMAFRLFEARMREREKADALRASEERYREIVERSSDVIYRQDVETGRFEYYSPNVRAVLGYTVDDMLAMDVEGQMAGIHPDDLPHLIDFTKELDAAERSGVNRIDREFRIKDRQGTYLWIHGTYSLVRDDAGRPRTVIGTLRDVTDRKRADEALRVNREYLESVFRAAPTGIGVVRDRVLSQVNLRICEMTGYTDTELVGRSARVLYPTQEDFDFVGREKYAQIRERGTGSVETRWRRKDGAIINVLLASTPLEPGDISKGVTFTALDITDRTHAEAALRESQSKFSALIRNSSDGILFADASAVVHYRSPSYRGINGYTDDERIGRNGFETVHPDDIESLQVLWGRMLCNPDMTIKAAYRIRHKDGSYRWVESKAQNLLDNPDIGEVVIYTRDITEQKGMEEALQGQLHEKEMLLRETHHRIKNNIASIASLLSLQANAAASEEAATILRDAMGRVNSMGRLYHAMLIDEEYRDLEAGQYLNDITDAVLSLFSGTARVTAEKRFDHFTLGPKKLFALGIIVNELLTNAMKYAFIGRDKGEVRIEASNRDGRITLTVQDDGLGVSSGTDPAASSGFGLMLVKLMTRQLNGILRIENNRGTQCTLEFPM